MSGALRIDSIAASSARFAAHHGADLPGAGATVELGDEVGRGGFATVFAVESIDGKTPARPLLAKLFDDSALGMVAGGGGRIATGVGDLIARLEGRAEDDWLDLVLALPFCMAFANRRGQGTLTAFMLDLRPLGYEPSPLGDTRQMTGYLGRPLEERQELAASFARKAALFEDVGFVHGDVNGQNLLVSYSGRDVQVIDVDAGVLVVRGDEHPLTPGKPDGFMPPEVKQPSAPGQIDITAFVPASERWSVACLVGYLLFGSHPAFFLEEISAASIRNYAREVPGWPEIDARSPLFTSTPENRAAYPKLRAVFDSLPDEVVATFRQLFAAGLSAERRPAASEWIRVLTILQSPPRFVEVVADGACVVTGMPVTVAWRAEGAASVEVQVVYPSGEARSLGAFPAAGSTSIELPRSAGFVVTARNPYGEVHGSAGPVRVLPVPDLALHRPPRPTLGHPPFEGLGGAPCRPSLRSAPPLRPAPLRQPRRAPIRPPRPEAVR
jgi:hypothetical protein